MRRKVKKSLTLFMALVMLVSLICSRELSAFAEDVSTTEQTVFETEESVDEATDFPEETWGGQTGDTIPQETGAFEGTESKPEYVEGSSSELETVGEAESEIESAVQTEPSAEELVEYQPESQPYGIQVKAYATAGILPEGTVMNVAALEEGSAEHSAAEKALEQSTVDFDGFKALDISFYDATGNVIEPQDGSVQVRIEMDASLLPEKINTDSLAVQHLNESTGKIEVQTVAEASVGTVERDADAVTAEFSVDSFSTFTITWTNGLGGNWEKTYFEIKVHCVNTNGEEIDAPREDLSLKDGTKIDFSKYAPTASGLKYKEARYDSINGQVVTALNAESTTEGSSYGNRKKYNVVTFVNENTDVVSLKYETTWGVEDTTKKADVYLVYETDVVTPPSPETMRSLTKSKTVVSNEDGTYDLNLEVSGAVGSINNPAKMDILLIIDRSGSMNDNEKLRSAKNAINGYNGKDGLIDIVQSNQNIDAQYAVVSFSSKDFIDNADGPANASKTELSWNRNVETVKNAVSSINANGGTNYQSGIRLGKKVLNGARSDAQKIVIFLTDGIPTYRLTGENNQVGDGGRDPGNYNISAAIEEIKGMSCNAFYAVGFGGDFTNTSENTEVGTAGGNLNRLCANVGQMTSIPSVSRSYAASNADQLYEVFRRIASDATSILCDHVSIMDILSENVEVPLNTEGQPLKLLVTVTDANDNTVKAPAASVSLDKTENNEAATVTASYKDGQLSLSFPDTYKLEPGWTYKLTTTIQASETAYKKYRESGLNYPDFADENTGTHSNSAGFYSNVSATVSYTYNGENRNDEYDHPVIQLHPGMLVIEKTIEGLEGADLDTLVNQLTFEVTIKDIKSDVKLSEFTRDPSITDKAKYVYRIEGLSPDTIYNVKEKNTALEGYDLTATKSNEAGTVAKDAIETASFTNSYTPSNRNLIISKTVSGNMGDTKKSFEFTMKIEKDGKPYTEKLKVGDKFYEVNTDSEYVFYLKDKESITFSLPYGCQYTVSEVKGDYTAYVAIDGEEDEKNSATGTLSEDATLKFRNDKEVGTPTGIYKTVLPYIVMVVVAIEAIICFAVLYLKKRIR